MSIKITATANAAAHALSSELNEAFADAVADIGLPVALQDYLDMIGVPTLVTITVYVNAPLGSGASNGFASTRYTLPLGTESAV